MSAIRSVFESEVTVSHRQLQTGCGRSSMSTQGQIGAHTGQSISKKRPLNYDLISR
jgi:hypothetical protein